MKREVNMMHSESVKRNEKSENTKKGREEKGIVTDPFGSWTGVCEDDKYEKPVQDVDDL